ncbi:hypothetical protein JCM10212_001790 [Sporobolomyces blumeae]
MGLFVTYLPHSISEAQVTEAFAAVLHRPPIAPSPSAPPTNFSVNVFSNRNKRDRRFTTSANLTIADEAVARRFLDVYGSPKRGLAIKGSVTRSYPSRRPVDPLRLAEVRANPFVAPADEKERIAEMTRLRDPIPLAAVAFGRVVEGTENGDAFSSEYEVATIVGGTVHIDGEQRFLVVALGETRPRIQISLSSLRRLETLPNGPSVLVTLSHGPSFTRSPLSDASPEVTDIASIFAVEEFRHRRSDRLRLPKVRSSRLVVQHLGLYSKVAELEAGLRSLSLPVAFQTSRYLISSLADTDRSSLRPLFAPTGGLEIAGREFEFLGYSQSALKDHSTWFVAPFESDGKVMIAESIRSSLGDFFSVINIPARYMARLAQAFTATQPALELSPDQIVRIDDIKSPAGSCMTDGVGKVSPALADEIEEVLHRDRPKERRKENPSAYQFRLGGAKGMLVVDPLLDGKQVQLRPSQIKYEGTSRGLDNALSFTRPFPCYLNRPLIKIVEDLGIPGSTFLALQNAFVARIQASSTTLVEAAKLLDKTGLAGPSKLSSTLYNLERVLGLGAEDVDPFLQNCEEVAISDAVRSVKFKARIPIKDSWMLVGIADEDGYLGEGEVYACVRAPGQPAIYLEGEVCISRSPSVHPGDVQVVRAVGKLPDGIAPHLRTLVNCVVFSVNGSRSLPLCLGGGDLDGDLYQLITLPPLIPRRDKLHPAADYAAPRMERLSRPATIDHGVDFFLGYVTSDLLGVVGSRHLQLSDYYPDGTLHPDCLKLAKLHSDAVDYPKTGVAVDARQLPKSPSELKPQFMCGEFWAHLKRGEGRYYYTSEKALGQLFRAIPLKAVCPRPRPEVESAGLDDSNAITSALSQRLDSALSSSVRLSSVELDPILVDEVQGYLGEFCEWLLHYASINTLSSRPDRHLTEIEVVLGLLSAPAKDPRARRDKEDRLQFETGELFDWLRDVLVGYGGGRESLDEGTGSKTFGFVVLKVLLDLLKQDDEDEDAV